MNNEARRYDTAASLPHLNENRVSLLVVIVELVRLNAETTTET